MSSVNHILLASHGTEGALAAARMALRLCDKGAAIQHLVVVPDLWKGMMGDDWLNNGVSRDRFARYLESELGREIDEHCTHLRGEAEAQEIVYANEIAAGEPGQCLIDASRKAEYDLVVMGSPRPKSKSGLRSRMALELLARSLPMPLLIVPYPNG